MPGSPTLSIATTFTGLEDEDDLASRAGSRRNSSSLAVPQPSKRALGRVASMGWLSFSRGRSREPSLAPSTATVAAAEPNSVEGRNKNAVRKGVLARLLGRGVGREDERFAGVFAATSKGIQFALVRFLFLHSAHSNLHAIANSTLQLSAP